jgi:hypothetical protein
MDESKYKGLFKKITKKKSGKEQDLEIIEKRLQHLRKNGALSYEDLINIKDEYAWPFNEYWMWPCREQIETKLRKTDGWFKNLPEDEEKVIDGLNNIFKNISLVSIVLRFIHPEHYAIYSRPPLKILRSERGGDDVDEYLNYVKDLRILRDSFKVTKTSEVDMIVWAIFYAEKEYVDDLNAALAEHLPGNRSPKDLVNCLPHSPLEIAKEFLKKGDYKTAGFWAAKAFEKFLYDECSKYRINITEKAHKRAEMIGELYLRTNKWGNPKNKDLLYATKKLRNIIIPGIKNFSKDVVKRLINNVEELKNISSEG